MNNYPGFLCSCMRTLYTSTSNGMKQGRQRISIVNSKEGKYMCTLWDLTHVCSPNAKQKSSYECYYMH